MNDGLGINGEKSSLRLVRSQMVGKVGGGC